MAYEQEIKNLMNFFTYKRLELYELVCFITNRCNQRCLTCWQWEEDFKTSGKELSDAVWEKILLEAIEMGAKQLYIVGGGEPMVRGNLVLKLGEIAKKEGLFCVLHTNGTLFTRSQMERLIEMKWDRIIFSIDGPNSEINDAIRGRGTFEKAIKNLSYFQTNRIMKDYPIPDLGINFTITNTNYKLIDKMVDLAIQYGCGGIHSTLVQPFNQTAKKFELNNEMKKDCLNVLRIAKAKAEEKSLYHTFDTMISVLTQEIEDFNIKDGQIVKEGKKDKISMYCFEPYLSVTVSSDGKVSPCCMYWNQDNPSVIGSSLMEIWNGEFFQSLRKQLNTELTIPKLCRQCPFQLRQRTENIKRELSGRLNKISRNPLILVLRFLSRVRNEGFNSALRRLYEWAIWQVKGFKPN